MRNSKHALVAWLAAGVLALLPAIAGAADQDAAKAAREQARRLQEQKRTLEMEKSQLLQEKTDLAQKLSRAEAEADKKKALAASLGDSQRRLRSAGERAEKLASELAEAQARIVAQTGDLEKLGTALAVEKNTRSQLEKEIGVCTARNAALFEQGRELIAAFGRHGECDAVARGEPVFGLGRVSRENALEARRDEMEGQRYLEPQRN